MLKTVGRGVVAVGLELNSVRFLVLLVWPTITIEVYSRALGNTGGQADNTGLQLDPAASLKSMQARRVQQNGG
jgi:hypothetical protein